MKTPETGNNRTGLATASAEAREGVDSMVAALPPGDLESEFDGAGLAELRARRARETDDGVGSVPPPATVAGKVKSAIGTLSGASMAVFMDRLGQRLAFERQGSRLYEGLIAKLRAADADGGLGRHAPALDDLIELHDEELQHFLLLTKTIADLGGDPTAQTPAADVSGVAGMGLPQVVNDPRTTFWQSLEAMLVAELVDNDGWETLQHLAHGLGYEELASQFELAREEEADHLRRVRTWLNLATMDQAGAI
jgi:hypothetical protein